MKDLHIDWTRGARWFLQYLFEPWKLPGGPPNGYPVPIVDHGTERSEALARYAEARSPG